MRKKRAIQISISFVLILALLFSMTAMPVFAYEGRETDVEAILPNEVSQIMEEDDEVQIEQPVIEGAVNESGERLEGQRVLFDPQPESMADIQAAIDAWEVGETAKPRWELEADGILMPSGWRCELADWDTDFGSDYYTFFPNPAALAADTLLPDSTVADLQEAINNADSGDVIEIQNDIVFTTTTSITIPAGKSVTIMSDMDAVGAPFKLTQPTANGWHFSINGSLTLENIILDGGTTGGGVTVPSGGYLIMNSGAVIQNCYTTSLNRGAVYLVGGSFTMYDGKIRGNATRYQGGAVSVTEGGSFVIGDPLGTIPGNPIISDNNSNRDSYVGGAVYVLSKSTFDMYAGEIKSNSSSGVHLYTGGSAEGRDGGAVFHMYGGTIGGTEPGDGNTTSNYGGGVRAGNYNTFIMYGGSIVGNEATGGAGIAAFEGSLLIIKDGIISKNVATETSNYSRSGGGVAVWGNVDFQMYGGEISENTAYVGGGVLSRGYVVSSTLLLPTFTMYGGVIKDNIATYLGGGVVAEGTFNLGDTTGEIPGNPIISGNTAPSGGGIYVNRYLASPYTASAVFNMGSLEAGAVNPVIKDNTASGGGGGVFISSSTFNLYSGTIGDAAEDGNSANNGGGVYLNDAATTEYFAVFNMYGGEIIGNSATVYGGGVMNYTSTVTATQAAEFYMYDGEIKNNTAGYGGGVSAWGPFSFGDITGEISGAPTISGNTGNVYGGGVYVAGPGSMTMGDEGNSGLISPVIEGNSANNRAGGIYLTGTPLTMYCGAIVGNMASYGGGLYVYNHNSKATQFVMYDGEITGNEATGAFASYFGDSVPANIGTGGGVTISYGKFDFYGGKINDNAAQYIAGGVYSAYSYTSTDEKFLTSEVNMYGGTISGNTANLNGGGVVVNGGGTFRMEDGQINANGGVVTVNGTIYGPVINGGGVFTSFGDVVMRGGEIAGNYALTAGGGVYVGVAALDPTDSGTPTVVPGVLTMGVRTSMYSITGSPSISNNTSDGDGGGVYLGVLTEEDIDYFGRFEALDGIAASITGNTAGVHGGGIYTKDASYENLTTAEDTVFGGNTASCYCTDAAASSYPNIRSASVSVPGTFVLNNYDINYTGSPAYYKVTYDANGGSGTAPVEGAKAENETFTAAANAFIAPDGMEFKEWNTSDDGGGTGYAQGETITMPDQVLTLYAIWGPITYTVTYDANEATSGTAPADTTNYSEGATVTVADQGDLSRAGYTFSGWNTAADGSGDSYSEGDTFLITGDITLYAQWNRRSSPITPPGDKDKDPEPDPEPTPVPEPDKEATIDGHEIGGGSGRDPSNPYDTIVIIGEEVLPLGALVRDNHIRYLNGYPDLTVRPEQNISRAEAAAIFFRLLNDDNKFTESKQAFSDVTADAWYSHQINYLAGLGIITGYSDGTFRPDTPITRAEFAAIASRFDNLILTTGTAFVDVPEDHWAVQYINSDYIKSWIDGYKDYSFKPEQHITRAEVVKIVNTMLDRAIDSTALAEVESPYGDIDGNHWAYAEIIEASMEHEYIRNEDEIEQWQSR